MLRETGCENYKIERKYNTDYNSANAQEHIVNEEESACLPAIKTFNLVYYQELGGEVDKV